MESVHDHLHGQEALTIGQRPLFPARIVFAFVAAALCVSCADSSSDAHSDLLDSSSPIPTNPFDAYMATAVTPADGFDFPVGDRDGKGSYVSASDGKTYVGWYIATGFAETYSLGIHPGEDWNGAGGGNTDLGQKVHAIANGRVVFAEDCGQPWGNVVIIEHVYYENHERRTIRSLYAHLKSIDVKVGASVRRRQRIATVGQDPNRTYPAHLHVELRWDAALAPTYWPSSEGKDVAWVRRHYAEPSVFIKAHRSLPTPQREPALILVDHESYAMRIYARGKEIGRYDVSFGQSKGRKRRQGDNRTPKGMYFVIAKQRGKFDGAYGGYFGGHWIKINYPNRYDAAWGRANGLVTVAQEATIAERWGRRKATMEGTPLGGGIGIHGWIKEWENNGPRHLSWGCIVMHLRDITKAFDLIPEGAMIVIL